MRPLLTAAPRPAPRLDRLDDRQTALPRLRGAANETAARREELEAHRNARRFRVWQG